MVATASKPARSLNATQLMLLKLFNRDMKEQEMNEIRDLLLNYLDTKLQIQLDKDIASKGISQADLDNVLNESQRTKI
jgi:hypothetical protein